MSLPKVMSKPTVVSFMYLLVRFGLMSRDVTLKEKYHFVRRLFEDMNPPTNFS